MRASQVYREHFILQAFEGELQQYSNWCWAAVATNVHNYYYPNRRVNQKEIAQKVLVVNTRHRLQNERLLNKQISLSACLNHLMLNVHKSDGPVRFENILDQMEQGRLVCARISIENSSGHFVIIYGVTIVNDVKKLYIHDPASGHVTFLYEDFFNNYLGPSKWSHTYYTNKK